MMRSISLLVAIVLCLTVAGGNTCCSAFVTPQTSSALSLGRTIQATTSSPASSSSSSSSVSSSTRLFERQWNFNEGQGPFGLKKNAEIWNGRVAQMAFVLVFIQELIQGKGVVQGLQEGDPVNIAVAGAFGVSMVALTGLFLFKGKNSYVDDEIKRN